MSDNLPDPNNVAPEADSVTTAAKSLGMSKGGLTETLDAIAEASPELGGLLRSLFGGPIGITYAVAHGFYSTEKEELDKQGKEMNDLTEASANPLGPGVDEQNKHIQNAKQAIADLQSALAHAGTDTDPIGTRVKLIKTFADTYFQGAKEEFMAQGKLELATLQSQNAPPKQILAALTRIRAKIDSLAKQKAFFDGSGLLMLEQAMRRDAQPQIAADATAAVDTQQKAIAKNQDVQQEIQKLLNETGKGQRGSNDLIFAADQKRLEEAKSDLAKRRINDAIYKARALGEANRIGDPPEQKQIIAAIYDRDISQAEEELASATANIQNKQARLSYLQGLQGNFNSAQAEATSIAKEKSDAATINQNRLDQLTTDIQVAQFQERILQQFAAKAETNDEKADQLYLSPRADGATPLLPPDTGDNPPPLPAPTLNAPASPAPADSTHPDLRRLNQILASLILEQDTLKKQLDADRFQQYDLAQRVKSLEKETDTLKGQLINLQSLGFR